MCNFMCANLRMVISHGLQDKQTYTQPLPNKSHNLPFPFIKIIALPLFYMTVIKISDQNETFFSDFQILYLW